MKFIRLEYDTTCDLHSAQGTKSCIFFLLCSTQVQRQVLLTKIDDLQSLVSLSQVTWSEINVG